MFEYAIHFLEEDIYVALGLDDEGLHLARGLNGDSGIKFQIVRRRSIDWDVVGEEEL